MQTKKEVEVQKLDPYDNEWNTDDFPYMTDEQLFQVMHKTMNGLASTIIELKKRLRWGVHIDDVGRKEIINSLIMELQKRFFDKEVIPVRK